MNYLIKYYRNTDVVLQQNSLRWAHRCCGSWRCYISSCASIECLEAPHSLVENKPHSQRDLWAVAASPLCRPPVEPSPEEVFESLDTLESLWLIAERWSLGWHREAGGSICLSLTLPQAHATLALAVVGTVGPVSVSQISVLTFAPWCQEWSEHHSIRWLWCILMATAKPTGFWSKRWSMLKR